MSHGHGPYDIVQIVVSLTWLNSSHRDDLDQVYLMHFRMCLAGHHKANNGTGKTHSKYGRKLFGKSNIDLHTTMPCTPYGNLSIWLSIGFCEAKLHIPCRYTVYNKFELNATWETFEPLKTWRLQTINCFFGYAFCFRCSEENKKKNHKRKNTHHINSVFISFFFFRVHGHWE